ncbi:SdpI family protein [Actinokineospora iranica]|uniref:SdpI/YhfL protein family protein n=1 Tax=Actinokineospora iranica TaxID=1271860 RepID=A0A1G6PKI6_9PSEU|nr:SdpI family protein [Actinokineospora iranica]SDC80683.1 SdpI/YhfL protein family protein [Actinokineospora iranica]
MNLVPLAPLVAGLPLLVIGFLGLTERLPRNRFGGVRTAATLRSDEAFRVGNKVAGLPTAVAGLVGVLGAVAGFLVTGTAGALTVSVVALLGLLGITLAAGVLGDRAARAVPEPAPELPAGCAGCQCGSGGCGALTKTA